MQYVNFPLIKKIKTKNNYKCCICGRKPQVNHFYEGTKGWICDNCRETRKQDIIEYNKKLESRRKYKPLEPKYNFKSVDELMQEKNVYFNNKIYNISIVMNWQYNYILFNLNKFNKAILKDIY